MAQVGLVSDKKVSIPGGLSQVDSKVTLNSASKQSSASTGKNVKVLAYIPVQNTLILSHGKSAAPANTLDIYTTGSSDKSLNIEPALQKGIDAYNQLNLLFEQNTINLNSILDNYKKSSSFVNFSEKTNQSNSSLFSFETGLEKYKNKNSVSSLKKQVISEYISRSLQPKNTGSLWGGGLDLYKKSLDTLPFLTHKISILTSKSTSSLRNSAVMNPVKDFYSGRT
jgi:hypothetical protein